MLFFENHLMVVKFMNSMHHFCQRVVERVRSIDDAATIVIIFKAWFPLHPFFPRCNLELGDFPFATLKAAFLHIWGTLAMNNEHWYLERLCQHFRLFISSPIG